LIYDVTKTDSPYTLSINTDILEPNVTHYIRAKFISNKNHESDWSNVKVFKAGLYIIDDILPSTVDEKTIYRWKITHDGGRIFDVNKYELEVKVDIGAARFERDILTWEVPDVKNDTYANIAIKATRQGKPASSSYTKKVLVRNKDVEPDESIIVTDFSNYEVNDGWLI
jgi:hypothetical protein